MYFQWSIKMENKLDEYRGHFMTICIDKKDGSERILNGVLVRSKGQFLINEGGIDGEAEFRQFNCNKIKWLRIENKTYYPKGETNGETNEDKSKK